MSHLISSKIKQFNRKISGKGAVRAGKEFTLFISNEDMNDVKKKQEGGFIGTLLAPLAASLVQPVISSVLKGISGRGVRRTGRGYINKSF